MSARLGGRWLVWGESAVDGIGKAIFHLYDTAFAAGAALGTDDAVAYVRRARGGRKRPSRGWDSLTPTELDVVRYIAAGRTNW